MRPGEPDDGPSQRECAQCVFWQQAPGPEENVPSSYGECRVNPPAVTASRTDRWPYTSWEDWCGAFKPRSRRFRGRVSS